MSHHPALDAPRRTSGVILATLLTTSLSLAQAPKDGPPPATSGTFEEESPWLTFSGHVRLRYEGIEGQFRSSGRLAGSDHLFFQRTALRADAHLDPVGLTLELLDSRHWGGGRGSSLGTGNVNAIDILQGFAEVDLGALGDGSHRLRVGRETFDLGSRRLVARNRYRNTINAFTGIDWLWEGEDDASFRAFWTLPVRRRPSDLPSVVDNEPELDDQDIDRQFFGAYYEQALDDRHGLELYALFLHEDDPRTRMRQIVTPGFRVRRKPAKSALDFELEAAYQFGDSRLSTGGPDLNHSAWMQHASIGYTFDATWKPRVRVALDYASGDRDPNDGDNQRFDTLFGARRFEYGPTGIYGAIARSNLLSPEVRLVLRPDDKTNLMFAWRGAWLASDNDAWTTAGVQDPTGASGRHVGQQIETRLRLDGLAKNVRVELGAAYLFHGGFQEDAGGGQNTDTAYAYTQVAWKF